MGTHRTIRWALALGALGMVGGVLAQAGQLAPGRIDRMPDLPQPYLMRDWKAVARGADALMFDAQATGEYLPLIRYQRPYHGNRYSDSIFTIPSYVGDTRRGNGLEGILTLPAVVSGLLVGIDKRDQDGLDYVAMTQDWWNSRPEEGVYLNNPLTATGNDWWYETMPNVFFQHLYALAAPYGEADLQLRTVATRWGQAVGALGGKTAPWTPGEFRYRSIALATLEPQAGGVPEPEAAGAIGYILDNAARVTGERAYRYRAEQAIEYLDGLDVNPRYELQLPYGVLAAARLNATDGAGYDLEKLLGWSFDRGPLRPWGVVADTWGGYDVSGLVGEADERGDDYVFYMNGVQAVGALAPVAKYDARFARAIGKYVLNVANASRLFYWSYLPADQQDSYAWASANDPHAYLAYEAMKETLNGESPFLTGDAIRLNWAPTNIGLYGTAHTGYLAAVVDTTEVPGILALDLDATDFLGPAGHPTRLYFNPHPVAHTLSLKPVGAGPRDLWSTLDGNFLARGVTDAAEVTIPAGEALLVRWTPTGGAEGFADGYLAVADTVVDYVVRNPASRLPVRLKAIGVAAASVAPEDTVRVYATFREGLSASDASVRWSVDEGLVAVDSTLSGDVATLLVRATGDTGRTVVTVTATTSAGYTVSDTASVRVAPRSVGTNEPRLPTLAFGPNPARGTVRATLPAGTTRLRAIDLLGRGYDLPLPHPVTGGAVEIAIDGLPAGVYYLLSFNPSGPSAAATLVVAAR